MKKLWYFNGKLEENEYIDYYIINYFMRNYASNCYKFAQTQFQLYNVPKKIMLQNHKCA